MWRKFLFILIAATCQHVLGVAVSTLFPESAPQTIQWTSPTNEILRPGTGHRLVAEASSGLPIQFRILSGPASIQGETLTITNIGTVWVEAIQIGNEFYSPTNHARAFNVRQVSFSRLSRIYPPYCRYVKFRSGFAFISDLHFGLRAFDVADPSRPVQVGSFKIGNWGTREIAIIKDMAIIAAGTNGLQLLNIAEPGNIQRVSEVLNIGDLHSVAVKDQFAFAAQFGQALQVFDLSEPQFPKAVDFDLNARAVGCVVNGDRLFLSNYAVMAYDIQNPLTAKKIATYSQSVVQGIYALEAQGNLLFTGDKDLTILDVAQPASPRLLSKVRVIPEMWTLIGLNVFEQYIYVLTDKVLVFDITNPSSPLLVGEAVGRGGPYWNVEKSEDMLYMAGGNSGLEIYKQRIGLPQTVQLDLAPRIDLDQQAVTLTALATSGLDVTYELVSGPAYINGNMLRLKSGGEVVIRAKQEGNEEYLPANVEMKIAIVSSRPVLQIVPDDTGLQLSWPVSKWEFLLYEIEVLNEAMAWRPVVAKATEIDGRWHMPIPAAEAAKFYVLKSADAIGTILSAPR